ALAEGPGGRRRVARDATSTDLRRRSDVEPVPAEQLRESGDLRLKGLLADVVEAGPHERRSSIVTCVTAFFTRYLLDDRRHDSRRLSVAFIGSSTSMPNV